jgi:SH3-like domain-containing protein
MCRPLRVILVLAGFFTAAVSAGWAQTPSGTLQVPASPHHDQPVKAPSAAPRTPVQKTGPQAAAKTPVVPPHGPTHPVKPAAKPAAAAPAKPPTPASPPAAEESKAVPAEKLPDPEKPEGVPSRLPRFASLRSDDVNMRAGPGTRYRIDWVYKRRDLPVEIEREFDVWRWVRDADGIQGWVHQATLMGRRSFIVQKADAILRSDASDTASAVATLKPGVIGRIRSCAATSDWCEVQTGSYQGFLRRETFWGLLPGETVNP